MCSRRRHCPASCYTFFPIMLTLNKYLGQHNMMCSSQSGHVILCLDCAHTWSILLSSKSVPHIIEHIVEHIMLHCAHDLLSRQKTKEEENRDFFVSLCLKLGTTICAPMGSWNYFKVDNKAWNWARWNPWGKSLPSHKNLLKDKHFTWVVEISDFNKAVV